MVEKCTYPSIEQSSGGKAICSFGKIRESGECLAKCVKVRGRILITGAKPAGERVAELIVQDQRTEAIKRWRSGRKRLKF